ncbi:sigma-70 family RNA polymerase sigma factor [Halalkalibacter alkaliphilus]|uniref:Sigma-70 family RNA polymerase sigma factor n=1 Tax=Halalkalibacter alkaliphilus TaxID=2917993 RepID=A0A9X2CVR8_9BACI|nr:sigma-70 family RNA polymerase sigma factor [Halalkalibacter alkaliphilus]MCL7749190.1 sigma-70 family RNA polymerase sigma factor [Halalkalibacter alkaliphilus]
MNQPSFEEVLKNFQPAIKKQLVMLRIYKDHDEFYQVGCLALWDAYRNFNPEKGNFSTYAISYIRGRMMVALRKESKYSERHSFTGDELLETVPTNNETVPLESELLEGYLDGLSEREKTWVIESINKQKKTAEIASHYNVSTPTVRSWKKGALKKLRNHATSRSGA